MTTQSKPLLILGYVNPNQAGLEGRSLPLGLSLVAASARRCGWEVQGRYWGSENTPESFAEDLSRTGPSMLGLYTDTLNIHTIARLLRSLPSSVRPFTVLGGPEAILNGDQVAAACPADVVARCDGEHVIEELIQCDYRSPEALAKVSGILWRTNGVVHATAPRTPEPVPDLIPERNLLPDQSSTFYLWTARGCPNRCSFCSEASRPYATRPLSSIRRELETEIPKRHPRWLLVVDDTFTAEPARARKVMRLVKRYYGGPWSCELTAHSICRDPRLAEDLAAAGLARAQLGIESFNDTTLRLYRKPATRESLLKAIQILLKAGVGSVYGNLIVGSPDETEDMIRRNIAQAVALLEEMPGQVEVSASVLTFNPGAPFHDHPERFGLVLKRENLLGAMDLRSPVNGGRGLSPNRILALHEEFSSEINKAVQRALPNMSRDAIRRHLNFHGADLTTIWGQHLLGHRFLARYYEWVIHHRSHQDIADIPAACLPSRIPQRTGVQVYLSIQSQIILVGLDNRPRELNASASFFYEMACGQHSIRQIARLYHQRLPRGSRPPLSQITDDALAFYRRLGEEMQVVFVAE